MAAYLVAVTAVNLGLLASPAGPAIAAAMSKPLGAEMGGFLLLTLPVVLYFALFEASRWKATLGKRALGIQVVGTGGKRLSIGRALYREAVRFLPWEMSHAMLWQVALSPGPRTFPAWMAAGFGLVYAIVGLYLVTLFVGASHRTVYDRLAGSLVLRAPSVS